MQFSCAYDCFYRTYEELKHHFLQSYELVHSGFYRTYEELKLVRTIVPDVSEYIVFIVPMRN